MSATHIEGRSGDFATGRRGGIDAYEVAFIAAKARAGLPVSQIAKQLGRPIADVSPYVPWGPPARTAPEPPRAPRIILKEPKAPSGPPPARLTRDYIVRAVADAYGVEVSDLRGPRRYRVLIGPRHEAMWRMMQEKRWSTVQVGEFFGGRDHSTVIFACKQHEARLAGGTVDLSSARQASEDRRAAERARRAAQKAALLARWRPYRDDEEAQPDVDLWKRLGG